MPAIVLTAAERWMTGVLSVDPVVLSIVGQYHPETDVLLSPNVHSHTVPEEDTKATLADESIVDLPRYPCVLISNYYEGTNAMEEALAILDTDPEYFVSGVFEGRDMIGVVRDGEQLGGSRAARVADSDSFARCERSERGGRYRGGVGDQALSADRRSERGSVLQARFSSLCFGGERGLAGFRLAVFGFRFSARRISWIRQHFKN
jgi:hypothetical protein